MLLGGPMGRGLSAAQRAARAWYAANGDRERAHTTGVWLRKSGQGGGGSRAGGGARLQPARRRAGNQQGALSVAPGVSRRRRKRHPLYRWTTRADGGQDRGEKGCPNGRRRVAAPAAARALRRRRSRAWSATADLPDGLRQSVSRAMCASLRSSRVRQTHAKHKTPSMRLSAPQMRYNRKSHCLQREEPRGK